MNLPAALFALRWLVWDTFRQSLAARSFWLLLALSGVCIVFCLSVGITGPGVYKSAGDIDLEKGGGYLTLGFGASRLELTRDRASSAHHLQALLAQWVAGTAGTLLILVWTAGFLPEFLQPRHAAVQLAKPLPRWGLLAGKYLGVVAFVAGQVCFFVGGTWVALGLRTGIWDLSYLLCIPLLLFHFAIVYSVSVLLAVTTRSTVICAFGSVLFWFVCCAVNVARHAIVAGELATSDAGRFLAEAGYWALPKPADLSILLHRALHAGNHFSMPRQFEEAMRQGAFHPELSLLTSLVFAVVVVAIAARRFVRRDY